MRILVPFTALFRSLGFRLTLGGLARRALYSEWHLPSDAASKTRLQVEPSRPPGQGQQDCCRDARGPPQGGLCSGWVFCLGEESTQSLDEEPFFHSRDPVGFVLRKVGVARQNRLGKMGSPTTRGCLLELLLRALYEEGKKWNLFIHLCSKHLLST